MVCKDLELLWQGYLVLIGWDEPSVLLAPCKLLTLPNRAAFRRLLVRKLHLILSIRKIFVPVPWSNQAWHRPLLFDPMIILKWRQKISKFIGVFSALKRLPEHLPWIIKGRILHSSQMVIEYWHCLPLSKSWLIIILLRVLLLRNIIRNHDGFAHPQSWRRGRSSIVPA